MISIEDAKEYGWGDQAEAFARWWNALDRRVIRLMGMSVDDLPDQDFAGMYTSGLTSTEAADLFIETAAADFGLSYEELVSND
jgi:hypothetical protein